MVEFVVASELETKQLALLDETAATKHRVSARLRRFLAALSGAATDVTPGWMKGMAKAIAAFEEFSIAADVRAEVEALEGGEIEEILLLLEVLLDGLQQQQQVTARDVALLGREQKQIQRMILSSNDRPHNDKFEGLLQRQNHLLRQLEDRILPIIDDIDTNLSSADSVSLDPDMLDKFYGSITVAMAELKKTVENLTADQMDVLRQIRFRTRAVITGCAGSGKTLVAAEKALRLSADGVRTIIICHNPFLSEHIRSLVRRSDVQVYDIRRLVAVFANVGAHEKVEWSIFDEPTDAEVERALDQVLASALLYDAVIVDEGQDFRGSWWLLAEALLADTRRGILYVFCDEQQSLVSQMSDYPVEGEVVSISKNCRNGGSIFEVVRRLHHHAPLTSAFLAQTGVAKISKHPSGYAIADLKLALADACQHVPANQIRVLTTEKSSLSSLAHNTEFYPDRVCTWQAVVRKDLNKMRQKATSAAQRLKSGKSHSEIANRFGMPLETSVEDFLKIPVFSDERLPNQHDAHSVQCLAKRMVPFFGVSGGRADARERLAFQATSRGLELVGFTHTGKMIAARALDRARFYSRVSWHAELPPNRFMKVVASDPGGTLPGEIPLHSVGDFKGLECDAVVLLVPAWSDKMWTELYIGASRAVFYLHIVIEKSVLHRIVSLSEFSNV